MPDNYDDIKHLSRPQYDDLPPMSMHDRAAQFSPFAALVGYDDAVAETARLTDKRIELSEEHMGIYGRDHIVCSYNGAVFQFNACCVLSLKKDLLGGSIVNNLSAQFLKTLLHAKRHLKRGPQGNVAVSVRYGRVGNQKGISCIALRKIIAHQILQKG